MALPTIVVNSSGSDTAASGAGPATALFGTAAALTSNTTVTLSVDAPDLSGVATDGSAVIWVGSSSGKQFAKITNIDNTLKTVTVSDAYGVTESGKNWGIGGKRASLAGSLKLGIDIRGGWVIDVQTDQTLTANFNIAPNSVTGLPATITSTVGAMATKIQTSTNNILGLDVNNASNLIVSNLYLYCTAGTPGVGIGHSSANNCTNMIVKNCIVDGWKYGIGMGDSTSSSRMQSLVMEDTEIRNCTRNAIWNAISGPPSIAGCYIHDNGSASSGSTVYPAIGQDASGNSFGAGLFCTQTTFANNYGPAIVVSLPNAGGLSTQGFEVTFPHCNFYKNNRLGGATASVMGDIHITSTGHSPLSVNDSIFYGSASTNFAVKETASGTTMYTARNNSYGVYAANTSGTGLSNGTGAVTLTGDPFKSSTDFDLNNTAGAGAACKGAGSLPPGSATATAPNIGVY